MDIYDYSNRCDNRKKSKVLLARRKLGKHLEGFWEFPGGKIEINETPEECFKRELSEELFILAEINDFFVENIHEYPDKKIKLLAYKVNIIRGDFKLSDHDKIVWVRPEKILTYQLAPADIPIAEAYINYNKEIFE